MLAEVLLALFLGGLVYYLVQRSKTQVLKTEDGWWGAGAPPDGEEDISIRPFKVTTSDQELEVNQLFIYLPLQRSGLAESQQSSLSY